MQIIQAPEFHTEGRYPGLPTPITPNDRQYPPAPETHKIAKTVIKRLQGDQMNPVTSLPDQELINIILEQSRSQAKRIMARQNTKNDNCYKLISEALAELRRRGAVAEKRLWEARIGANDNARYYIASSCLDLCPPEAKMLLITLSNDAEYPFVKTNAYMALNLTAK